MICGIIWKWWILNMFILSLKQLYAYLILMFTCLCCLWKKRSRWFSKVRIPRALVLYMLWRRVKNGIIPSQWFFFTRLIEKARCLKDYLYKASISVLSTENLSTTAEKQQMLPFSKDLFIPSTGIKFPIIGLSGASWLVTVAYPQASFTVLQGSFMFLKYSHPTWLDTCRVHTVLKDSTNSVPNRIYRLYRNVFSWHQDEQVTASATRAIISPMSSFVIHGHPERRASHDKEWGARDLTQAKHSFAVTHS